MLDQLPSGQSADLQPLVLCHFVAHFLLFRFVSRFFIVVPPAFVFGMYLA
jgi:hypothetical protein